MATKKEEKPVTSKKRGRKKAEETPMAEAEIVQESKPKTRGYGTNNNLVSFSERTANERRELAKKAGVESGKVRRRKKEQREMFNDFLDSAVTGVIKSNLNLLGIPEENMTWSMAMFASIVTDAVNKHNLNAFRTAMEYAGRAPLQEIRENEAIARLAQAMQLANMSDSEEEDDDSVNVVFYIPDNGRPIIRDEDLVEME